MSGDADSDDVVTTDASDEAEQVPNRATLVDQVHNLLPAQSNLSHEDIGAALDILEPMVPRHDQASDGLATSWDELSEFAQTFLELPVGTPGLEALKELVLAANGALRTVPAPSQAAIHAHHLKARGAYDDDTLITGTDNKSVGRDWDSDASALVVDLQTVAVVESGDHGAVTLVKSTVEAAPWPEGTRLYRAPYAPQTAPDSSRPYRIRTSLGTWWVAGDVVAELVANDPARKPGAQFLLLGSQDLDLSRAVATAAGTPVWSATGTATLHTNDTSGTSHPVRVRTAAGDRPVGQWAVSLPNLSPPLGTSEELSGQYLYEADGPAQWVRDADVVTFSIVNSVTHEPIGRASFTAGEMEPRQAPFALMTSMRESFTYHPAYEQTVLVAKEATPWTSLPPGSAVYVFAGHHDRYGRFWWVVRSGDKVVLMWGKPESAAGYLKRRPSLEQMRQQTPGHSPHLLVLHCAAGGVPVGSMAQGTTPSAQILANETGYPVYASTTRVASMNEPPLLMTFATNRGELEGWKEFRPEPADAALEDLARAMDLHTGKGPAPAEAKATAKRLTVVLRQVFGPSAEDDAVLLAGIGALERLRRADALLANAGPFTLSFLKYASEALRQAENQQTSLKTADTTDSTAAPRTLLQKAAQWLSSATVDGSRREPPLSDYLHMPHVQNMPAPLPYYDVGMVLAPMDLGRTMAAPADHFGTNAERHTVAYWSMVHAALAIDAYGGPTDDLVRAVLHLPPDQPVTPHLKRMLTQRVAQSLAANRNGTDPAAWAAENLVRVGALLSRSHTFVNTRGGRGINLTKNPITRLDPGRSGEANILVATSRANAVETTWRNGSLILLPFEEIAELIDIDLQTSAIDPWIPVLLILSGDSAGQQTLAQAIADRTGRLVYLPSRELTVSNADADGISHVEPGDTVTWLETAPYRPRFASPPLSLPTSTATNPTGAEATSTGAAGTVQEAASLRAEPQGDEER
jgi:hypothetical protein